MNKVSKFLLKLSPRERERIMPFVVAIERGNVEHLDCVKLKDRGDEYRVRAGSVRIQFLKTANGNIVTHIGFRNESTYR